MRLSRALIVFLAAAMLALIGFPAIAQTWTGGGSDSNWSTAANWSGGTVPVSGSATTITFAGNTGLSPIQDIGNPFTVNSLTFGSTAGPFTLGGNGLNFVNNGSTAPSLAMGTKAQTVNAPLNLNGNLTVFDNLDSSNGGLTLNGPVTGNGALVVGTSVSSNVPGVVTLAGPGSSFSGGLNIQYGSVALGASNVLTAPNPSVTIGSGSQSGGYGATFNLNGFNQTLSSLAYNGASSTGLVTVSTGTGTLTLANLAFGGSGQGTIYQPAFEDLNGTVSLLGNVAYGGTQGSAPAEYIGGTVDLGGAVRTFTCTGYNPQNAYDLVVDAVLTGTGNSGLRLGATNGYLALNNKNTYSGPTILADSGSILWLGVSNALPATTDVTISAGTLSLTTRPNVVNNLGVTTGNYNQTIASLSGTGGAVNLGSATLTINQAINTTYAGAISDTGILAPGALIKVGTGVLTLAGTNTYFGGTYIDGGVLRVGGPAAVPPGYVSIGTNGTMDLAGFSITIFQLHSAGIITNSANSLATLTVGFAAYAGSIIDGPSGPIALTKVGTNSLTLTGANTYSGGTAILDGTLSVPADSALGTGNVSGASLGTLAFTGTTATTKSFAMNGGAITVSAGQTVTFNGSQVTSAVLDGGGTFATNGAIAVNVTTTPSVTIASNSARDQFVHFDNSGALNVAAGVNALGDGVANLNGFTNEGVGSVTIGAGATVNASNFQSYGSLTLVSNTPAVPTVFTNVGTAPLGFNGGSRTFIGTVQQVPDGQYIPAYLDLHGQNAIVVGGLFVNNGGVYDTSPAGTATIIADYGALVKGAGFYQNTVKTQNGGKFQTGNSPGLATFGNFVFGPGGVTNYIFAIDDATGVAGPSPNAAGLVSGWGLIKAVQVSLGSGTTSGNFTWTATPSNPLTVAIDTLVNPTTVGTDVAGPMADFDSNQSYSWTAAHWTGTYAGPTDAATLDADTSFDTSGFGNPIAGTFGWSLDPVDQTLSLVYTPSAVPEPSSLALIGVATAAAGWQLRRWSHQSRSSMASNAPDRSV